MRPGVATKIRVVDVRRDLLDLATANPEGLAAVAKELYEGAPANPSGLLACSVSQ